MLNVFYKDKHEYTNELNLVNGYIDQLSKYISVKKSIELNKAKEIAIDIFKKNFKDRPIKYFEREENGDRCIKDGSLLSYINKNIKNKNILVPTFTSYMNSSIKKSILSEFISENVKRRSKAKKEGQKAKAENNLELAEAKNNEQNAMKIYNNSLSGAFAQKACILYNPTAHSTLTSVIRTITSLSNASNERLISGNRYYPRGIDILNNITYIVTYADIENIKSIVNKYNLYIPTVDDVVNVLKYSSDLYFVDNKFYSDNIIPFLSKLNKYELCAICYIGDLYHIRKFNDSFIRNLIDELTLAVEVEEDNDNVVNELHSINENILNFVHYIFYSKVKGYGKDYDRIHNDKFACSLLATCRNIENTLIKYKDFFNCFFMTNIFPANVFRLKNMNRRTVVLSDTDSTCYTLDEWVKWYNKEFYISDKTISVAGCIAFITSQVIINQLAILSKYMNISYENLNVLAMKNEYLWLVHVPSEVSKHYFAYTSIQEGNVFKEPDIEIKGVHLKNSAVPKFVIDNAKTIIEYILKTVSSNEKISLNRIVDRIIELENDIKTSVYNGHTTFLKKSKIKDKDAYALSEDKSPYSRHVFWNEVFSSKYGNIDNPPYDVIKIPTILQKKSDIENWLNSISDINIRNNLSNWLLKNKKSDLPTIYLNYTYVLSNGIPDEIKSIIDIKRIQLDVTIQHRIILESLGVMLYDDLLVSEQFN